MRLFSSCRKANKYVIIKANIKGGGTMKEKLNAVKQKIVNGVHQLNNKHRSILVGIEILIALSLGGLLLSMVSQKNWNAQKIVNEMISQSSGLTFIEVSKETQVTLPDNMKSTASFNDQLIKIDDTLHLFAGCVEVFDNHQQALLRKTYLESLYKKMQDEINVSDFGKQMTSQFAKGKEYLCINGNVLLRLDSQYSSYQSEQLIKVFNRVLEEDKQTERNLLETSQIEQLQQENEKRAEKEAAAYKETLLAKLDQELTDLEKQVETADIDGLLKLSETAKPYREIPIVSERADLLVTMADDKLQSYFTEIEDDLAYAYETLEQEDLDAVREKVQGLEHSIFDDKKVVWNDEMDDIQRAINERIIREYKEQCAYYEYDDVINNIDSYVDSHAYFRGKIIEISKTDTGTALRVNITPVYSYFTDTILYWEDSIYVELDPDAGEVVQKNDLIEMWGVIEGTTTHSTLFGGDQQVMEFYCRYVAKNG